MLNFCVCLLRSRLRVLRARSSCLGALLRVPRPAASSFTYAEHPGSLISTLHGLFARRGDHSQHQAGGVCRSEVKEESKGGSLWTGDMSADRYPQPVAGTGEDSGAPSAVLAKIRSNRYLDQWFKFER